MKSLHSQLSQINQSVQIVLLTHDYHIGVLERIRSILSIASNTIKVSIVIVDTSSTAYKQRYKLGKTIVTLANQLAFQSHYTLRYIDHPTENRFSALNTVVRSCESDLICFRTDDDDYSETTMMNIISRPFTEDFITTPYYFNQTLRANDVAQRPLESVVFKTEFLKQLLPFDQQRGSDWRLLSRAYQTGTHRFIPKVILDKVGNGQSVPSIFMDVV